MEALGIPKSLEEVNRRYHGHGRDPAANAAPLYRQAFREIDINRDTTRELGDFLRLWHPSAPLTEEAREAIEGVVSANQVAIDLFKEAAAKPYAHFDLDFTEGFELLLPHVSSIREGARLLAGAAIIAAERSDANAAVQGVQAIFEMAKHLSEEPTMISQLTGIALEGMGKTALEYTMDRLELAPPELVSLRATLRSIEVRPRLAAAVGNEVAFGGWAYEELKVNRNPILEHMGTRREPWEKVFFPLYQVSGILTKDHHFYLTLMEELLRIVDLPHAERLEAEWPEVATSANPFHGQVIASLLLPSFERVAEADTRSVTYLRAGQIALAVEQYRREHGRLPSSPGDLVPAYFEELPSDPYAEGEPFRFVYDEGGFSVRSSGTVSRQGETEDYPIEFRLPLRSAE